MLTITEFFLPQIKAAACIWVRLLFGFIELILSLSEKSAITQIQAAALKRWKTFMQKKRRKRWSRLKDKKFMN